MWLIFLLHGIFFDEDIRCLEYGVTCVRDGYELFLNDEKNPPNYEEIPDSWYEEVEPDDFDYETNSTAQSLKSYRVYLHSA